MSGRGISGTFGADGDSVTLSTTDFCQSADGEEQSVDGEAAGTRYAQFTFLDEVIGHCVQDGAESTITMIRGSGVVRNTDSYKPEIYGTFEIGEDISRCTLRMNDSGEIISESSSCTNESGTTIEISSELTCTMDADLSRQTITTPIEGHMSTTATSETSISFDCHEIYPLTQDEDGFTDITSNCSTLSGFGFNLEALTLHVVAVVNGGSWEFSYIDDISDILNQAKILRLNGYPVLLRVNLLYSDSYNGSNPEVLDPYAEFPQDLIDDTNFQMDLTSLLVSIANDAEHAKIELLAPLSEADRIFAQSITEHAASTYLQNIITELKSRFTGSMVAIFSEIENSNTDQYNLTDFDYAGVSVSPRSTDESFEEFQDTLGGQLSLLQSIANDQGVPYLIVGAGIWGDAVDDDNAYDWNATEERIVEVFQELYDRSQTFEASGIIFREGFPGEVTFSGYVDLQAYITSLFEPDNTDTDVDGEYDPSLSALTLSWDIVRGPLFIAKGMAMIGYNDKLYVFGGSSAAAGERTQIYNIASNSWSTGANMPRYRESAVVAEVDGLIYVIGGNDPNTCGGNYRCAQLSSVDVYNPATNSWSTAASLNERRDVAGAVVYDGKIYVVGGMYSEVTDTQVSNRDSIEVYNPDLDTWTVLDRDIPYPIRSAATAIVGDVIYVFGGCSEHAVDLDELEAENTCSQTIVQTYDIGDDVWTVLDNNMPTGRHFSGQHAAVTDHGILVFGGATDLGTSTYGVVEAFALNTQTWTYATEMQAHRKSTASTVYNGYLYVAAGAAHGEGYGSELTDGMERTYIGDL